MHILWSSNAPWLPSGYGNQTRLTLPQLRQLGHTVALHAWCGFGGGAIQIDGMEVYGGGAHPYGVDTLVPHAVDARADIAITLIDAWVYNGAQFGSVRWVPYFPIDSEPVSPNVVNAVKAAYERIVYSRFACEQMEECGLSYFYVPHMIDTDMYYPEDAPRWREHAGIPADAFVVAMVAANKGWPSRKSIPQCIEAFARFRETHEDAILYLHMDQTAPPNLGGVDVPGMIVAMRNKYPKSEMDKAVRISSQYQLGRGYPPNYMRSMYSSIDVLLNPSMGEGFGLPIVEAQACGCPVIVGDWTSMPELLFAGWKIERDEAIPFWCSGYNTYQFLPLVDAIVDRLEKAYAARSEKAELGKKARAGALQYSCDKVADLYWKPTLEAIERRVKAGGGSTQLVRF